MANQQAQELLEELKTDSGIPLSVIRGGNSQGTYVCKELVYAYAMYSALTPWVMTRNRTPTLSCFGEARKKANKVQQISPTEAQSVCDGVCGRK